MSVLADGWLDWTEHVPGPSDKQYSEPNQAIGYVPHSAVGFYGGWVNRLFSNDRMANGRYTDYAAASVHGFVRYDGHVIQHYPLTASCWANGNAYPNTHFVAFETEGGFPDNNEPLTQAQVDAHVRIINDWSQWKGFTYHRRPNGPTDMGADLWEHREMTRFGSAPTSCPSARMPWDVILARTNPQPQATRLDGWNLIGPFWVLFNGGVPVFRIGSTDGLFPGRISKLFGSNYAWLRTGAGDVTYWSDEEGD